MTTTTKTTAATTAPPPPIQAFFLSIRAAWDHHHHNNNHSNNHRNNNHNNHNHNATTSASPPEGPANDVHSSNDKHKNNDKPPDEDDPSHPNANDDARLESQRNDDDDDDDNSDDNSDDDRVEGGQTQTKTTRFQSSPNRMPGERNVLLLAGPDAKTTTAALEAGGDAAAADAALERAPFVHPRPPSMLLQRASGVGGATSPPAPTSGLLPEDTYSLMAFATTPVTLILSWATLAVQLTALGLLGLDVIDFQDSIRDDPEDFEPDNPLGIPAGVAGEVAVAQLLALIITLLSESNVLWSLNVFLNGYDRDLIRRLLEEGERQHHSHPLASTRVLPSSWWLVPNDHQWLPHWCSYWCCCGDTKQLRWGTASFLRFLVGIASLTATFVLIVQSETVLDILLNFTAIEFISHIDNSVFLLAKWGHFGRAPQRDANQHIIDEHNFTIRHHFRTETEHCKFIFWNGLVRLLLYFMFLGGWTWIFVQQSRGRYQPATVFLQLGDATRLELATYTGIYRRSGRRVDSRRFSYIHIRGRGRLTWCRPETAWVFVDTQDLVPQRPCGWKAVSITDFSFDILNVAREPWFLNDQFNIRTPLETFQLTTRGRLQQQQTTTTTTMSGVCPAGRFGWNCEFSNPCSLLSVNEGTAPFTAGKTFPTEFQLLEPHLAVYSRPVYVGIVNDLPDVLLFLGRRWVLVTALGLEIPDSSSSLSNTTTTTTTTATLLRQALVDRLTADDFALHDWSSAEARAAWVFHFVSEPVDVGTPLDALTPVGLRWIRTRYARTVNQTNLVLNEDFPISSRLICATCTLDSDCNFNGICINQNETSDGRCQCPVGARGRLCEIPPVNNGFCNPQTNSKIYNYDGGDCCLSTCDTTREFACGRDARGYADTGNAQCHDPKVMATAQQQQQGAASAVELLQPTTFEFGRAVVLNDDGTRMAVASVRTLGSYFTVGRGWEVEFRIREGVGGFGLAMGQTIRGESNNPLAALEGNAIVGDRRPRGGVNHVRALHCGRNVCQNNVFVMDSEESTPPLPSLVLPDPVTDHPRLLPFPLAAALAPDGKFIVRGGYEPDVWVWVSNLQLWFRIMGWQSTAYVLYISISSTVLKREQGMTEFTAAYGEKDFAAYPGRADQPLHIRVFRTTGSPTSNTTIQLGSTLTTDFHLLHVTEYPLRVPGDHFADGQFAASAFGTAEPAFVVPEGSVLLSNDARILAVSSFFVVDSDLRYDDVYGGERGNNNNTDAVDRELEMAFLESLHGRVDVYEFQESDWVLRQAIDLGGFRSKAIQNGWRTDLSRDGNVLVIGTSETITSYFWDRFTREYVPTGDFASGPHASLSLSRDASTLAVGYPAEGLNGVVRVFRNDFFTPCQPEQLWMRISFTTGENSPNTYYEIVQVPSGVAQRQDGPLFLDNEPTDFTNNMTFTYNECFLATVCSSVVVSSVTESLMAEGTAFVFFNRTAVPWKNSPDAPVDADCEVILRW